MRNLQFYVSGKRPMVRHLVFIRIVIYMLENGVTARATDEIPREFQWSQLEWISLTVHTEPRVSALSQMLDYTCICNSGNNICVYIYVYIYVLSHFKFVLFVLLGLVKVGETSQYYMWLIIMKRLLWMLPKLSLWCHTIWLTSAF